MSNGETARRRRAAARLATWAERAVDRCQGTGLPRADWVVAGWPRALVLPLLVALPFLLSGLVRTWLGWSLRLSLVPALALAAAAVWPWAVAWRAARGRPSGGAIAWILPLVVAALSVALLYNRAFAGLTNYAGGDGGVHAFYALEFANEDPAAYEGFVSMYAVVYWIEQLGRTHVFWALCGTYYAGVVVVAVLPCLIASAALSSLACSRAGRWTGAVAAAIAALATAWYVILPQQHYHQTDGFFVHLFGLVPLFALWLVDATTQARLWRWLWLAAGAVVYRYTYGLNLADLALALSALAVADSFAPGAPAWLRWPLRATPIAGGIAAWLFFRQLAPLISSYGWIIPYPFATVLAAEAVLVLALGLVVALALRTRAATAARALRLPLAFVAANWADARYLQQLQPGQPYYLLKYPVHGVVLGAAAVVVVAALVGGLVADALAARPPRRLGVALAGLVGLALATRAVQQWRVGFAPLWPTFEERVFRQAPYHNTRPLADLAAWPRIERTLARQHKQFGGYITPYWPMFHFMNAAFGYYNGGRQFWEHGLVNSRPGYCEFWDRGKVDWWSAPNDLTSSLRLSVDMLERHGGAECVGYRAHWNTSVERTLCYVCD